MLRMSFLNWFWGFWNWLSNLIGFKDVNDTISSSKETIDSPRHDLSTETKYLHWIFYT